jgi:superfamily I DNA/RNA helicase/RecB family exonuclease
MPIRMSTSQDYDKASSAFVGVLSWHNGLAVVSSAAGTLYLVSIKGFERKTSPLTPQKVELDAAQRGVLSLGDGVSAAVIGAPGTGKTTTIIELVADRVDRGYAADEILVLTQTRATATRLRDRLATRLGIATNGPLARTINSLAFEVVTVAARASGGALPRLVTGGEQDSDIAQLLAGHEEAGHEEDGGTRWPTELGPEVRRLRTFRTELRELMMRATEYGVSTRRLRELGTEHGHAEWIAGAEFIDEYLAAISSFRENQLDSAELAQFAVAAIASEAPGQRVSRLRLVIVDDLQEATESTLSILRALAARDIAVIAFGDPDVAANAFRGGEPDALGRLATVLGVQGIPTIFLATAHRHGQRLRALTSSVTSRIGAAAAGQQRAAVAGRGVDAESIATIIAQTPGRERSAIARALREQHLLHGIAWSEMAVIVRSGRDIAGFRQALAVAEVPTRSFVGETALRDDPAARALLSMVSIGIGRTLLDDETVADLLLGPFGGLDRLGLRRLVLALRTEELAGGGSRPGRELLVEALAAPSHLATIDYRFGRQAGRLAKTLAALAEVARENGSAEDLLWLAWDRSGLATQWREQALGSGIAAAEANRNLDGVLALFTAATRFVERRPGAPASVFLDSVLDADVPEDTLSPQPQDDAVVVTTASGSVGLEFEVVVVAGLQEGAWPNSRLRGSLLNAGELVRIVTGVDSSTIDERRLVIDDELRMFALAVSRARSRVILAAVANDDEAASAFLSLAPEDAERIEASSPLTLRALVGRLRRDLGSSGNGSGAAAALARLASEKVPGADPADWHGLLELSTTEPLFGDDEPVPVSPSQLEKFEGSPLDWFIDSVSGTTSSVAMGVGTIVHWAMETAVDPTTDSIFSAIESRWNELVFESPWLAESGKHVARILAAGVAEYLGDFARDSKTLVGAERRFELQIGRAKVSGSIDRVERSPDGAVVIVDLKTGKPETRQPVIDAFPQLGAYQLAYAEGVLDEFLDSLGDHHSGGAKLLFVREGVRSKLYREGIQAALTEEQLEGFRERIRQAAIGMAAAEFSGAIELSRWGLSDNSRLAIHRVRAVSSD